MPNLPTLSGILGQNQGMGIGGIPVLGSTPFRRTTAVPPALPGFPALSQEAFFQAQQQKAEEPGLLMKVLTALGAGEYAVAGFLDNVIKGLQGRIHRDPFEAAARGFKSAFNNDVEARKTAYDLLTTLGWKPQGTTGEVAKFLVGLLGGVVIDPVTYAVGIGAARGAFKVAGKTASEVFTDVFGNGARLAARFRRGMWINRKMGRRVLNAFTKEEASAATRHLRGVFGEALKAKTATAQGAQRALRYSAESLAQSQAAKDVARLGMVAVGDTAEANIARIGRPLINRALTAMGKETTAANAEWFVTKGYRKLFDPGGLKVFGLSLFGPSGMPLTPAEAGLAGHWFGFALQHDIPLVRHAAAEAVAKLTWHPFATATKKLLSPLRKLVVRHEDARAIDELVLRPFASAQGNARIEAQTIVDSLLSHTGGKRLTRKEMKLAFMILDHARAHRIGTDLLPDFIDNTLKNPDSTAQEWFKLAGFKHGATDLQIEHMKEVVPRIRNFLVDFGRREEQVGLLDTFQEEYMTRVWKKVPKEARGVSGKQYWRMPEELPFPIAEVRRRLGNEWVPNLNLDEVLHARIARSLASQNMKDATQSLAAISGRFPHVREALQTKLADAQWVGTHPELAAFMSTAATMPGPGIVAGISKSGWKVWRELLRGLEKSPKSPEWVEKHVNDFLQVAKKLRNLTQEQYDALLQQYNNVIKSQQLKLAEVARLKTGTEEVIDRHATVQKLQALRSKVADALNVNRLDRTTHRIVRGIEKEVGKAYPASGLPLSTSQLRSLSKLSKGNQPPLHELRGDRLRDTVRTAAETYSRDLPLDRQRAVFQTAERTAERLDHTTSLVDDARKAREALARGEGSAREVSNLALRAHGYIQDELEQTTTALKELWRIRPQGVAAQQKAAQLTVLRDEFNALLQLRSSLFRPEAYEKVLSKTDAIKEAVKDVTEIHRLARQAGVGQELSGIVSAISPSRSLEGLTKDQRKILLFALKGGKFNRYAAEFWRARPTEAVAISDTVKALGGSEVVLPYTKKAVPIKAVLASHPTVAKALHDMVDRNDAGFLHPLVRVFDSGTNTLKKLLTTTTIFGLPRVPFFLRNTIDLLVRGGLMVGTGTVLHPVSLIGDGIRVMRGSAKALKSPGLRHLTGELVQDALRHFDLWNADMRKLGIRGRGIVEEMFRKTERGESLYLASRATLTRALDGAFKPLKALRPQQIGAKQENFASVIGILNELRTGKSFAEAIQNHAKFLFYYGNLTGAEKEFARRVFLFYNFTRQAVPFVAWSALKRPWLFASWRRLQEFGAMSPEDRGLMPDWIKEYPFATLGVTNKGFRVMSLRNVFTIDTPVDIFQTDPMRALSNLNPLLTVIPEITFNYDLFFRRPIPKVKFLTTKMQSKALQDTIGKFLKFRVLKRKGKEYVAVDGRRWFLLNRLWFSRIYREIDTVASALEKKVGPGSVGGMLTGFKILEFETERQRILMEATARHSYKEYRQALKRGDRIRAQEILEDMRFIK